MFSQTFNIPVVLFQKVQRSSVNQTDSHRDNILVLTLWADVQTIDLLYSHHDRHERLMQFSCSYCHVSQADGGDRSIAVILVSYASSHSIKGIDLIWFGCVWGNKRIKAHSLLPFHSVLRFSHSSPL